MGTGSRHQGHRVLLLNPCRPSPGNQSLDAQEDAIAAGRPHLVPEEPERKTYAKTKNTREKGRKGGRKRLQCAVAKKFVIKSED